MFRRYKEKEVKALVQKLKEEYEGVLQRRAEAFQAVREENRLLRARLSVLESQRGEVSDALVHAVSEGERIKEERERETEEKRKELVLLAEKCRLLSEKLLEKYPDEDDCREFKTFTDALRTYLGEESEEETFDLDAVLNPKEPLDLGKLCRELGLMEE